jgi:hypothetical protein
MTSIMMMPRLTQHASAKSTPATTLSRGRPASPAMMSPKNPNANDSPYGCATNQSYCTAGVVISSNSRLVTAPIAIH